MSFAIFNVHFYLSFFYRYSNNRDHVQPNEESLAALLRESGNVWESLRRISFVPDLYHHGVSTFGSQKKTLKLCSCVGSTSTMIWVCVAETGFLSLRMRVFPSVKLSLLLSLYKALISPFLRLQPSFFCPLSWEILSIISFKFLCLLFTSTTIVLTCS